jgi:hypothetical protein
MQWRGRIKSVTRGEDGKYSFATDEGFIAMLGQGVTFTPGRYEIWDGSSIKELPKTPTVSTVVEHDEGSAATRPQVGDG